MVIFGGRTVAEHGKATEMSGRVGEKPDMRDTELLNDTHILDLNTLRWIPSGLSSCLRQSKAGESPKKNPTSGAVPAQEQQQQLEVKQPAASATSAASVQPSGPDSSPSGEGQDGDCVQEISVLDLGRRVWLSGGEYHGQCSRCLSTVAGAEERPMARRRRRYLERVAAEQAQEVGSPSACKTSLDSTPTSPNNIRGVGTPSPAASATMLPALLNPRKNSWHRGEGHPFDLPSLMPDHRQRFKSDSGLLVTMVQDDSIWDQDAKLQENLDLVKTHGLLGLGMDPDISKATAKSGGAPATAQDAVARVRKPSLGTPSSLTMTQSTASSTISSSSSGSASSRQRSQSQMSLPLHSPSSIKSSRASQSPSLPVTHAVPPKFFTKSTGSMFDLDDLATTIARERKPSATKSREASKTRSQSSRDKDQALRRSNSNTASIGSSHRSSGFVEETKRPRSYRGQEADRRSEKRRSLDSAMETADSPVVTLDGKEPSLSKPSRVSAAVCQPLYVFSSHPDPADKQRHEFMKIQSSKGCCKPDRTKATYDIKPEWTALDVGTGSAEGSEGLIPPRMLFPVGQVVDHYFLLSGATLEDSTPTAADAVAPPPLMPGDVAGSTLATALRRRHSYSVWMHHLNNHQWTQLELSKNLNHGEWNQSVLDRENNILYILGQRDQGFSQVVPMGLTPDDLTNLDSPDYAAASFGDMIKVDLEGFEICPAVDEASMGPKGVKLGLEMLRDGIGADVVLVSSADGGRVRVNSGIVGQRWGYFQTLMQERARIRSMEAEERLSKLKSSDEKTGGSEIVESDQSQASTGDDSGKDSSEHVASASEPKASKASKASKHRRPDVASKQWYLGDKPAEIVVRETTPILVGFLQYIYTNDLATPHQLKLKTLQGLLLLAHFYDLTRLQQLVRRALYQQLNASNAPAICEVAVLTHEFGLQTRALRTLLQSARLAQMRQQGEAAEAKRRLEFAMSRLEEIEEDRKRKASMHANNVMLQQQQQIQQGLMSPGGSTTRTSGGNSTLTTGNSNVLGRLASTASSTSASQTSTPGLSTIGRFFRHREESVESIGPVL
ncbi:hypothetical protein BGZ70_002373 [Mortierella alpina]|uniref:BTB domain-containing protein n=1 Tax=Mortierella alpina TaxID=64518 RepID=A0A9P6IXG4_MORAP|nr:hypothetical protein BGZ70_002373 [Mortierella alpina]